MTSIILHLLSVLKKGENEGLGSTSQEMLHKLNELTAHCEEVERQCNEEAEKSRLLQVHTLTVRPFSSYYTI